MSDVLAFRKVLTQRDDLDMSKVILAGQSRGGFLPLALAAEEFLGALGVINYSGGWYSERCGAGYNQAKFSEFGEKLRIPTLSIYGNNDNYYSASHVRKLLSLLGKKAAADSLIVEGAGHLVRTDSVREIWLEKRNKILQLANPP